MARKFTLRSRVTPESLAFLRELNPEQLEAATAPGGPILMIAGAGTGKTRALTSRLAWLIANGVDPSRILLVTFTNRAAREMLDRAELLTPEDTSHVWGGTFHHIANRLLRKYGRRVGVRPDFTILDREDARDLVGLCVSEAGIPVKERRFPQKAVLGKMSSFVANTLAPLGDVLDERFPDFIDDEEPIAEVLALYARRKRQKQLLDYDDLLADLRTLLRDHDDIRERLAEQFLHVLVDEYQDTNAIQGEIVDFLSGRHRNVCVVGDDSQSIYSFRGARLENIVGFRDRYPDVREIRLETNYRSTPEILKLANESIARNTRRLPKQLRASRPSGYRPAIVPCHDHLMQSRFVAEYVLHLLDEGRTLEEIAVLYRSHWHSTEIQLELSRRNIPFKVRGGLRFFEQAHVKDVVAFMRLVHNPQDELAWMRALQLLPKVGGVLSRRCWVLVSQAESPLQAAQGSEAAQVFPKHARPFYGHFVELVAALDEMDSPADMIGETLRGFYDDYMKSKFDNARMRREDVKGLQAFAEQYATPEAFLADMALAGDFSAETVVEGPDADDYLTLSTIHQAKGLEWEVVLIPWLAEGYFPTDFAINSVDDEEEERRVFHVAVTRAKEELYLAVPQTRRSQSRGFVMMKPSRFLTELSEELTEPMELEQGLPELIAGEAVEAGGPRAPSLPAEATD